MKYKLLGYNHFELDPLDTIFQNRGVKNYKEFLNLSGKDEIHYSKLKNIDIGAKLFMKHVRQNSNIHVQVDSDCDGYTSSAVLINYTKEVFPDINITWSLQEGKQHGIIKDKIPKDTNLLIVPDAGSNEYTIHRELHEKGIEILILDHHESDKESKHAVIINNQLSPDYKNKALSAAGIVYKFCQALDDYLNINKADGYLDLVAVGNIGDMMDLREKETRYLVKKGLENIQNPLLKEIIIKQDFSMGGIVNIHNVAFYIVPLINAAVRAATIEEKESLMKSLLGSTEEVYYKRKDLYESIQTATARNLGNIRSRQNKSKERGVDSLIDEISKIDLKKEKVIILDVTEKLDKKLTGLVANQIAKQFRRPVLLYRDKEEGIVGGSARGYENGETRDFKAFLLESKLFKSCEGHGNAFGFEIEKQNIKDLKKYFCTQLKEEIILGQEEVDFILEPDELNKELVTLISDYRDEWGSTLVEPQIAIKNIPVQNGFIYLTGKKNSTLKFEHNDVSFIKFHFKEEVYNQLFGEGETFYLDVVGKCKMNEWEGNRTPQISIEKIEIVEKLYF